MAVTRKPLIPEGVLLWTLGFLHLHLDDLSDVIHLLRGRVESFSIHAGRATVDDPDELADATSEELRQLTIRTVSPNIVIELGAKAARVWTFDDSERSVDLADDLARLLKERSTPLLVGSGTVALYMFCIFTLVFIPAVVYEMVTSFSFNTILHALLLLAMCGFCSSAYRLARLRGGAKIHPIRRGERRRKTRELALWGAGLVATSVVSGLLVYLQVWLAR